MPFTPLIFTELDSSQEEAKRRLTAGTLAPPAYVLAQRQTAGRGSRGRHWESPAGNLHVTYVIGLDRRWHSPQLAVYPIALAVGRLVDRLTEGAVALKWPNDVLLDGAKLSGALHERADGPTGPVFLAGIGLNLAWHPEDLAYPAADLSGTGPHDPAAVAERLGQLIAEELEAWLRAGFAPVRARYLQRMAFLDAPVTVTPRGGDPVAGVSRGLAEDGALILETGQGRQRIYAGDIFPTLP